MIRAENETTALTQSNHKHPANTEASSHILKHSLEPLTMTREIFSAGTAEFHKSIGTLEVVVNSRKERTNLPSLRWRE